MKKIATENSPRERGTDGRVNVTTHPSDKADGIRGICRSGSQAEAVKAERDDQQAKMTMEEVLKPENLNRAYKRVVANKGSPGVDGMRVEQLGNYLEQNMEKLADWLRDDKYRPKPVRKAEVEKPGGGTRMLGVPTVVDRFIQQALLQVLQPYFDARFSDHSYGYRPGRDGTQAVLKARGYVEEGKRWVVDMDLEKFFDHVNHDVLMARLWRHIADKRILHLIRRYLKAGMMADGLICSRSEGTPQGGPLSPLLSNILLDELDKELEKRGHRFVRYADDCNIYVASQRAGERVLDNVEKFLSQKLRLKVNRNKSAVDRPWKRKFLGYSITSNYKPRTRIAKESIRKLKKKVKKTLKGARGRKLERTISELNPQLRGWMYYFRYTQAPSVLKELDAWIRIRLRVIIWRQWKRPRTRLRKLKQLGLSTEQAVMSAWNRRGPTWNARYKYVAIALSAKWFANQGLLSLEILHRRLSAST